MPLTATKPWLGFAVLGNVFMLPSCILKSVEVSNAVPDKGFRISSAILHFPRHPVQCEGATSLGFILFSAFTVWFMRGSYSFPAKWKPPSTAYMVLTLASFCA
jgi:hypothetical protein